MKAYKVTLLIVDHDELGEQEIKDVIENTDFPNHCMNPEVMDIKEAEIGEWDDDHPLNKVETTKEYYEKIFGKG